MTIQEKLKLRKIINAAGKMTALGGSALSEEVTAAMSEAGRAHIEMDLMLERAGEYIAQILNAEAAVPTCGAAAGIAISVAATVAGSDMAKILRLPESTGRNQVVLMKGHSVNFGAPVTSMIRLGGGQPIEVGSVNLCSREQLEEAITAETSALLYVKSHHAVQKGMVPLDVCVALAHRHGVPIIVDAAAEEDLSSYPAMGIDLTCFSGGKAILGPTSGIIVGTNALCRACRLQYRGIGRAMKVGKESVAGLIAALEAYCGVSPERAGRLKTTADYIAGELRGIPGVSVDVVKDESGREIWRTELRVDAHKAGLTAADVVQALVSGDPAIYTRNHYVNTGVILIDPRPLADGEEKIVVSRLREVICR